MKSDIIRQNQMIGKQFFFYINMYMRQNVLQIKLKQNYIY